MQLVAEDGIGCAVRGGSFRRLWVVSGVPSDGLFRSWEPAAGKLVGRFGVLTVNNHEMSESTKLPIPPRGDLLTAEEVAALLRVTPAWVYAETRRHRIPHIRLGRYVRYRSDALAVWMDQLEDRSGLAPGRRSNCPRRGGDMPSRPT
jgi:excisionase family DNA binding protein